MVLLPIQRMQDRVEKAKQENDDAYFRELMVLGEMILKMAIAGMISSIVEGPERNQYRLKYLAVRESTPGGWESVLDEMRLGVAKNQYTSRIPRTEENEFSQLTRRTKEGDWQYDSTIYLVKCLELANYIGQPLTTSPRGYEWFKRFAELRNKAKSHRAPFTAITRAMCPLLQESISLFLGNFSIFGRPWGQVVRSMNGTYQVVRWTGPNKGFKDLEGTGRNEYVYHDGIYIEFANEGSEPVLCKVDLMQVGLNGMDVYLPNGQFKDNHYEMLSYAEDDTKLGSVDILS